MIFSLISLHFEIVNYYKIWPLIQFQHCIILFDFRILPVLGGFGPAQGSARTSAAVFTDHYRLFNTYDGFSNLQAICRGVVSDEAGHVHYYFFKFGQCLSQLAIDLGNVGISRIGNEWSCLGHLNFACADDGVDGGLCAVYQALCAVPPTFFQGEIQ